MSGKLSGAVLPLRHPKTTVRWRLTVLYGGLFLVCGAALLAVTYTLVAHAAVARGPRFIVADPNRRPPKFQLYGPPDRQVRRPPPGFRALLQSPAGKAVVSIAGNQQRIADLHQLEVESAIALAIMAIISAALGWLVAGRVLRPLRTITATTRQISEANLHERLALPGPRDELRTLADTIDGLLQRLEGAFDAQRRFVANASHELRTPLTAARTLLEIVLSDPGATVETFREACAAALDESEQQEQLIDALLALAQGQRGIERREVLDLALITDAVIHRLRPDALAGTIGLEASLQPAALMGDQRLIERLVSNLVQNAIHHNVPDGSVRIAVQPRGGEAALTVANTGPLVPADEVERLLLPFQRLAADRTGYRDGLGLGLSIVAAIAAAHGAALDVEPGEPGGLHVEVRFPSAGVVHEPALPRAGAASLAARSILD